MENKGVNMRRKINISFGLTGKGTKLGFRSPMKRNNQEDLKKTFLPSVSPKKEETKKIVKRKENQLFSKLKFR